MKKRYNPYTGRVVACFKNEVTHLHTFPDSLPHFAASLGLISKEHSSDGKQNLLSISKRGDVYARSLLVHGGRAVVR